MTKRYSATVLLTSLVLLSGLLLIMFMSKEKFLDRNKHTLHFQQIYLQQKMDLVDHLKIDPKEHCQQRKIEQVVIGNYGFYCERKTIFKQDRPTKRHILFEHIDDWLDIDRFYDRIYTIHTLSELPETKEDHPKVVRILNPINERLTRPFYGIIITDYVFDVTDNKIYGQVYSAVNNDRDDRDFIYRREILEQLEREFSTWHYLPHSKYYATTSTTN